MKRKILIVMLVGIMSIGIMPSCVQASSVMAGELTSQKEENINIENRINFYGKAYLSTSGYSNITSSNNFFDDKPKVTNSYGNESDISIRVVDDKGNIILDPVTITVGTSVILGTIHYDAGKYTIQGKSLGKNAYFTIAID